MDRRSFVSWAGAALAALGLGKKVTRPVEPVWTDPIPGTPTSRLTVPVVAGEDLLPGTVCYIKASDGKVYGASSAAIGPRVGILAVNPITGAETPVAIPVRYL